jgi:hypothetical protein
LRFAGPDAASFLQGQISNDTAVLTGGSPLLAAYSTPQGRVVALMHLLPHSSGILALIPHEIVLPTLERLRKFVMRAKVKIEDISDQFAVLGLQGSHWLTAHGFAEPAGGYSEHDGIGIGRVGASPERYWVVGTKADLAAHGIGAAPPGNGAGDGEESAAVDNAWRLADIRDGLPQVYAATREMFVAQMLNMDLIAGISFTKGCYTGQEIIARAQHLGRIKRRLFRLRLPAGSWAIGQTIHLTDGRGGRLTELAHAGDGIEALAVLNIDGESAAEGDAAPGRKTAGAAATLDAAAAAAATKATQLPLPYLVTSGH